MITPYGRSGFATNASQSAYPQLWRGLKGGWSPQATGHGVFWRDLVGNNHGTVTAVTNSLGPCGVAGYFNESTSGVIAANRSIYHSTNFTVTGWVRINATPGAGTGPSIVGCYEDWWKGWLLYITTTPALECLVGTAASWRTLSSTYTVTLDKWYHFAFWHDSSTIKLYINGTLERTGTGTPMSAPTASIGLIWGRHTNTWRPKCNIGEWCYWNRTLNMPDIRSMAYGASPFTPRKGAVIAAPTGWARTSASVYFA